MHRLLGINALLERRIIELEAWAEEAANLLAQDYTGAYVVKATKLGLDYEKLKEQSWPGAVK